MKFEIEYWEHGTLVEKKRKQNSKTPPLHTGNTLKIGHIKHKSYWCLCVIFPSGYQYGVERSNCFVIGEYNQVCHRILAIWHACGKEAKTKPLDPATAYWEHTRNMTHKTLWKSLIVLLLLRCYW